MQFFAVVVEGRVDDNPLYVLFCSVAYPGFTDKQRSEYERVYIEIGGWKDVRARIVRLEEVEDWTGRDIFDS